MERKVDRSPTKPRRIDWRTVVRRSPDFFPALRSENFDEWLIGSPQSWTLQCDSESTTCGPAAMVLNLSNQRSHLRFSGWALVGKRCHHFKSGNARSRRAKFGWSRPAE